MEADTLPSVSLVAGRAISVVAGSGADALAAKNSRCCGGELGLTISPSACVEEETGLRMAVSM